MAKTGSTIGARREKIRKLYYGRGKRPLQFQYGLLAFDILTVAFFLATSLVDEVTGIILVIDLAIAFVLTLDYGARLWVSKKRLKFVLNPVALADVVVIVTLLLPALVENFAFLRVIRALRLIRSYHILKHLRREWPFFRRNEDILNSLLNLVVFIFVVTALVYVLQVDRNAQIQNYVDALYFTVTTLTTTGFGDITLEGSAGRLLAVIIMVFGVALFLRLIQTIFRPQKIHYRCPDCGLSRHEPDAVHCKHCGRVVDIETEGED